MIPGIDDCRGTASTPKPKNVLDRDLGRRAKQVIRRPSRNGLIVTMVTAALLVGSLALLIPPSGVGAPTTWTFMVYMDADNNLEDFAIMDFMELSAAGSSTDVHIVVQFDRIPDYNSSYGDWSSTKRFLVTQGMTPTPANATADIGEANMGAPQTLVDFVEWAVGNYSATNYVLILWDHGRGWGGICWDDSNTLDFLDMVELGIAFDKIYTDTGIVYDIIGFDACSMGSLEVAYQISPYAHYMIGSELLVPNPGYEYSGPLTRLKAHNEMSELDFANEILSYTAAYYESLVGTPEWHFLNQSYEYSIIDLSAIPDLLSSVSSLSTKLVEGMGLWVNHVTLAREQTEQYPGVWGDDVVDLHHLAESFGSIIPNATIDALASAVIADVETVVLSEVHGTNPSNPGTIIDHVNGITIYFPLEWWDFDFSFGSLQSSYDSSWDEFLNEYYNVKGSGDPTVMYSSPQGLAPTNAVVEIWFSEEMDYDSLVSAFSITPSVSGSLSWDSVAHKLTFTPSVLLTPSTTYTVTISTAAVDLEGNHLQIAYVFGFTVGENIPEFHTLLLPAIGMIAVFVVVRARKRAT